MATLADLIKGFRYNVREGYQTTLIFTGNQLHLTCENKQGYVGISEKPSHKTIDILFNAEQNDYLMRTAKHTAQAEIVRALKKLISMYICYNNADKNLIKCLDALQNTINYNK